MEESHYDSLQVSRNASDQVIRAAYKALSQRWHPDRNQAKRSEAERIMSRINIAYAVLSDSRRRAQYDSELDHRAGEIAQSVTTADNSNPGRYGSTKNLHTRGGSEVSWLLFAGCIAALYSVVLWIYGIPAEGGHIGTTLLLTDYAGRTLGIVLMGAAAVAVIWLVNRMQRRSYETPRRDLLIASFVSCYLMLLGDNRITASVFYLCVLACLGLIYWPRITLPSKGDLPHYLAGSAIVALPIALIAVSAWLANYSMTGALVTFALGAAILLYLFLHRSARDQKEP